MNLSEFFYDRPEDVVTAWGVSDSPAHRAALLRVTERAGVLAYPRSRMPAAFEGVAELRAAWARGWNSAWRTSRRKS